MLFAGWRDALCLLAAALCLNPAAASGATTSSSGLRGSIGLHDPSTILKHNGRYYIFGTGAGTVIKSSTDAILWRDEPRVFATPPNWVTNVAPGFNGDFWAPDVTFINGQYHLYYSASSWGSQQSAIALATNPTLDPSDPNYLWTDQGVVIQSVVGSAYNTIDPSIAFDANGQPWMAFGSYWNGIYLVQLDPITGKRIAPNSPLYQLADNGSIEAACLYRRGNYYYLFVNWGSCCDGVDSTYHVRVGRSTSITGPYVDRNGVDLRSSGGTLFMEANGKFTGPGHVAILNEDGQRRFSYHYYDAGDYSSSYDAYGAAKFDLAPLSWTADHWPEFFHDWSAIYQFEADARDENEQYYGMIHGGTIQTDAGRGRVLDLNGTNQFVRLPAGVANARTFAAVVKWNGGPAWQRILDFGTDTTNYVMLTPSSSNGRLRADLRVNNVTRTVEWTSPLPIGVWTHVALTLDGARGVLYVNGAPVATNASVPASPFQVRAQTNHLGRSKFVADADFSGQISSFRVYGRVLSATEIAAPLPVITQPASDSVFWPGKMVSFAGRATDFNDLPLTSDRLSWRVEHVAYGTTNLVFGPVSGIADGKFTVPTNTPGTGEYRVLLTATNTAGRSSTATVILTPANAPSGWSAHYPFTTDASDANGLFPGTLIGGAAIQDDPVRGPVLNLSGANQYVSLPSTAGNALTFMAWVKWNGGAAWQRIMDFGNDTNRYCVLTPSAANGKLRFNITLNSIAGEQILDGPGPLPVGEWTHVAVVLDGLRGVLYTNGVPVATNAGMTLVPGDLNATNVWLGRSHWPDPYYSGRLSSVRLLSRPLSVAEITAPISTVNVSAAGRLYRPGETIQFNGSATDFTGASLSATSFVWSVQWRSNTTVTTIISSLAGLTNGSFNVPLSGTMASNGFFRVQLVTTDNAARKSTNMTDLLPLARFADWGSFYPFNGNANDASNRFHGSLVNGASIVNDSTRGLSANLGGGSQHLNLPAGASAANTISGWVKWNGGAMWQRLFDFGVDTTRWCYFTPRDGSGFFRCGITTDGSRYTRIIQGQTAFPTNEWVHLAVVFDGRQGIIYTNGQPAVVHNSVNLLPADLGATRTWFGRSQFTADAYFNGRLDSIRLESRSLSLAELIAPRPIITAPTSVTRYSGGAAIGYQGAATDYADAPLPAGAFSWHAEFLHDDERDPAFGPVTGVTSGNFNVPTTAPNTTNTAYRIHLTVTDTNGNFQATSTDVFPRLSTLSLATVPPGLQVMFEGESYNTPASIATVAGMERTVGAPSPQTWGGADYGFVLWSDGGAATHLFTVPLFNTNLTASFVAPAIELAAAPGQLTLTWPTWAGALQLASATNLTPPVVWQPVTNVPIQINQIFTLQLPVTEAQQYFRLQTP